MDWYRSADADFGGDGTYYVGFTDFSEIEKSADNHVPWNAGSVKQSITMWNLCISLSKWDNYKGKIVIKVMHMYGQACG